MITLVQAVGIGCVATSLVQSITCQPYQVRNLECIQANKTTKTRGVYSWHCLYTCLSYIHRHITCHLKKNEGALSCCDECNGACVMQSYLTLRVCSESAWGEFLMKKKPHVHIHTHTPSSHIGRHDYSGDHEWQSHVGEELGCSVQTPHREGEGSEGLRHETFLWAPQTETLGGSRNTRIQKEDESYQLILSFIDSQERIKALEIVYHLCPCLHLVGLYLKDCQVDKIWTNLDLCVYINSVHMQLVYYFLTLTGYTSVSVQVT